MTEARTHNNTYKKLAIKWLNLPALPLWQASQPLRFVSNLPVCRQGKCRHTVFQPYGKAGRQLLVTANRYGPPYERLHSIDR